MAKVQRVRYPDRPGTFIVVDELDRPIAPAREYLRFLTASAASPNTIRAYAAGLAQWWTVLEHSGHRWDEFPTTLFGQFLTFLRTGDLPGTRRIGPEVLGGSSTATVQLRATAVLSFYRFHADAHHLLGPYEKLFTSHRQWRRRSRYVGFLDGVGPSQPSDHPIYRVRQPNRSATPVLLPREVAAILNACATHDGTRWSGAGPGLRNRLLFAILAETGMRLGEALSLRHHDFHIGGGGTPYVEVAGRQDHPHEVRCKTGPRRIYVGDDLAALYSEYVWALIDDGADLEVPGFSTHFVFVNLTHGTRFAPIRPETVYAAVRSITRRCNHHAPDTATHTDTEPGQRVLQPGWTPHWLRHTHATALLLSGVAPHVVMRRLGHADVQTTLSTYGWVTEDAEMRSIAQWRNYVAGWKGLHDDHP
ncbi:Tyrosine recombinase XerD (plasmid) [Tsukamurella tyrosinosolvens]|uniref:Tyrosine-type recombinase/integrase n=3 Tax=Tsukamurella TaxID=2060 RepID=A0A5C5RNC5_9ACTN|nr:MULTISPECIES: tyrosine-type recombinase/integrase [Tsukamurella]KXO90362.1 transposase [Tsukamurella pulmonis]KXO95113.1 transposase [Tsukamurella tyrosinosolvens]TWS24162.1 tyrosine-type recombinase/integrase [Tsukamurella sputi]SDQ50570.1 Site-specific recombinase XerD [Tsukamurella pulmonis]SED54170.1 Site-specific recombinase XerD [Tsukamurella tyrosinosolvens]